MAYLIIASLIFSFSFGLIKGKLDGVDPYFIAFIRLLLSFLVFLPWMRLKRLSPDLIWKLLGIGAIQYGIMYLTYIYSYRYLASYEVALFTIFTPLYVTAIAAIIKKRWQLRAFGTALLSIVATAIMVIRGAQMTTVLSGFILLQISNLAFACGQVFYVKVLEQHTDYRDEHLCAILLGGAVIVTAAASALFTDWQKVTLTPQQVGTLLYLGLIASGLSFFLWNKGARLTSTGLLAVMNNLKIPGAVLLSLFFFGETASPVKLLRLTVSFALMFVAIRLSDS